MSRRPCSSRSAPYAAPENRRPRLPTGRLASSGPHAPAGPGAARRVPAPKRRFQAVAVMAAERIPVEVAGRVLEVSTSGYSAWRSRPPSARAIRMPGSPTASSRSTSDLAAPTALWGSMPSCGRAGDYGRPQRRRPADAPRRPGWRHPTWSTATSPAPSEPAVGHRHHRAPHSRGQARRRGRPGFLLPSVVGWSLDATPTTCAPSWSSMPSVWPSRPVPTGRRHHPLGPRRAGRIQLVVATPR
jgi:hypothetical protein